MSRPLFSAENSVDYEPDKKDRRHYQKEKHEENHQQTLEAKISGMQKRHEKCHMLRSFAPNAFLLTKQDRRTVQIVRDVGRNSFELCEAQARAQASLTQA